LGSTYYYFIYRPAHAGPIETAYVLPPSVQVVDTPAEVRIVVGTLKSGERVEVTKRTHNWAQIRSVDNITGWVENKDLLESQAFEGGQKLLRDLSAIPAQAEGHTSGIVNLRLEPARDATQLAQLPEGLKVLVFGRRLVERVAPEGQASAAKVRDAWYLIRAGSGAGWVMGRFIVLDIPADLSGYAQESNLVAWVVLNTVQDEGHQVPEYLTADRVGTQDADFSHIRVFTWWVKNHKFVTAYVESNLNGYFPVRVAEVNGIHYFRLLLIDREGNKIQKVYGLFDTITRPVGTVPGWESDAMPAAPQGHHRRRPGRRKG
jgi:SH3-like domain-containing protein